MRGFQACDSGADQNARIRPPAPSPGATPPPRPLRTRALRGAIIFSSSIQCFHHCSADGAQQEGSKRARNEDHVREEEDECPYPCHRVLRRTVFFSKVVESAVPGGLNIISRHAFIAAAEGRNDGACPIVERRHAE